MGDEDREGITGDNKLYGEEGNDTISGGSGKNTIDGGDGSDTVTYSGADYVTVTLRGATNGVGNSTYGGINYLDKLISIENVMGSAGNDTIQGNE
mgnify:CR=1 FL=1